MSKVAGVHDADEMSEMSDPTAGPAVPPPLPAVPDADWSRVLCVVAHPDDMEYGTSSAVATWTRRGVEVCYLLLTAGEAGMAEPPEVVAPLRAIEQRNACAAVGVTDLRILDHPDGMLEYGLALRRDIARVVRQVRPDAVVTANFDVEAYGGFNQADHRAAGLAVVDGVRDAANPWVFRELAEEGLAPWHTGGLLVANPAQPTHAVTVDEEAVRAAVASLNCHEAYLRHVTDHPRPEEMIPEILRAGGAAAGTEYAAAFRYYGL
ncbi:MAG: family deacetylase [Citricoccus sp.]|nr:family deacetylase [Citricoccus sp. WCRC_4]